MQQFLQHVRLLLSRRVLADVTDRSASYTFKGDEGYVRARVLESNGLPHGPSRSRVGTNGPRLAGR